METPNAPQRGYLNLTKLSDRVSQEAVKLDKALARLQVLFLDAVGPLATILEEGKNRSLTADKAMTAAKTALRFIGNASIQMSRERRKRTIAEMIHKLIDLSERDSIYENAPPFLFGDQFAKEAKERKEQLRCLDWASSRGKS